MRCIPEDHTRRFLGRECAPWLSETIRTKFDLRTTLGKQKCCRGPSFRKNTQPVLQTLLGGQFVENC